MGLDSTFGFRQTNDDGSWTGVPLRLPQNPDGLVYGVMQDTGDAGFRGKVYADFVEAMTGVSLYAEAIPHDVVCQMAKELRTVYNAATDGCVHQNFALFECLYGLSEEDIRPLVELFESAAAIDGTELWGWW